MAKASRFQVKVPPNKAHVADARAALLIGGGIACNVGFGLGLHLLVK